MTYRMAEMTDLDAVCMLVEGAVCLMEQQGIYQWDEVYPARQDFRADIEAHTLYLAEQEGEPIAVYVLNECCSEEYLTCPWQCENGCILHRFCVSAAHQHQGVGAAVLDHIEEQVRAAGYRSVRLDAFTENPYSLRLYGKRGYVERGHADWRKGRFILMEKKL